MFRYSIRAITCLAALGLASLSAQERRSTGGALLPEQAAYDVKHYDLVLRVDPEDRRIEGSLTATLEIVTKSLPVVVLDLDDRMTVASVTVDGERQAHQHEDGRLRVTPSQPLIAGRIAKIAVQYGGVPRNAPNAPWDGGFSWKKTPSGAHWVATTCQGDGADLWWPCKDHPSDEVDSMDLRITVPKPLVVASNGKLMGVTESEEGWRTYHWHVSTPINNYGVALNIAPYVLVETRMTSIAGDEFPVQFYALPENEQQAKDLLPEILDHLRFFEKHFGPYAFRADKYGVAQTPHLGMEHQSIIAYGYGFKKDHWGYDWLHHHELSHEWWGNLVTAPDWNDFWIHEGIGTYTQALYIEELHGIAAYHTEMRKNRGVIGNRQPLSPRRAMTMEEVSAGGGNEAYYKGAWVLHTLRSAIGKDALMKALRRLAYPDPAMEKVADGRQCHFGSTDDLLRCVNEATGTDLSWFFEVYVRRAALPKLIEERSDERLTLRWEAPDGLPFDLPMDVEVEGTRRRVEFEDGKATLEIPAGAKVVIDPDRWVLRALRREAR